MEDKEVVLRRAKNAVIARDFNLAIRLYKSLLQEDVKNLSYLNALGNLYMKANDDQKALLYFQQILTFYPDNFEAMNACGGIYRRMEKYNDSITILQRALDTGINPAQVNYNLGFTYKLMGNDEDAIECFENVIAANPTDVLAYNHLGSIYAGKNDNAKAVATYKRGLQIDPNHPILQFNMAKSLQAMHDDGSAIQAYECALRARPGWQDAIIAYSEMLLAHRKTKAAGELVQNGLGLHPQDAGLYVQLGRVLMRQNNFDKAAYAFETANRLAAKNADTLRELASAYEKLEKNDQAKASIKEAQLIKGDDLAIQKTAISILLTSKDFGEAKDAIKEVSEKNQNDPEVFDLAGQYSILVGQDDSAKSYEEKIKKIAPEYIAHLYSYATRYAQKGNYVEAKARIKSFIDEDMKNVPAWILLGQIDEALGNPTDALDDYTTAVAFDPNNHLAGQLAKKLGEKIDSEVNSMEIQREASASAELAGTEEISLDEFDLGSDEDAAIVPDEELSEEFASTDGLKEENDADILGMDDVTSLFESGDDEMQIHDPDEAQAETADETEETEESEEEAVEETEEETEEIPEPFEDNSNVDLDLGSLGDSDDDQFSDWSSIDPDSGDDETLPAMDVPLSEPATTDPEDSMDEKDVDLDSMLGGDDEPVADQEPQLPPQPQVQPQPEVAPQPAPVPEQTPVQEEAPVQQEAPISEQTPAFESQPQPAPAPASNPVQDTEAINRAVSQAMAEEAAKNAKIIEQATAQAEHAAQAAQEAKSSAERSWMAAQNAADMMQGAEQMEKHLEDKANEAVEQIQNAAENQYSKLMDQVTSILPRLTVALEDPAEIEKFRKEIELFKRLRQLGECLPLEQRNKFLTSRVRVLLDYIIARLSGRPGLLRTAVDYRRKNSLPEIVTNPVEAALSRGEIVELLKSLTGLTSFLQDQDLAKALIVSVEEVIERL